MKKILCVLSFLLTFTGIVQAETQTYDLRAMMESGKITVKGVAGNGSSSGASLEGYLVNETSKGINLDTSLSEPIYFRNSGVGQNMITLQVYGADGRYKKSGQHSFITLRPHTQTLVKFIAYCTDYEKENPSSSEVFSSEVAPSHLSKITVNINKFSRSNPKVDTTKPAQVAIWLAQGVSPQDIQKKFPFSPADEQLARYFLK